MKETGFWTPPFRWMPASLPSEVPTWLDQNAAVTVATSEPDGRAQLSVVWATCRDNQIVFSTVKGRRKYTNLIRDPRATVLITPPNDQDHYVEIRCVATIEESGGRALIDFLHERHRGIRPYPWDGPDDHRVVVHLAPEKVLIFHG